MKDFIISFLVVAVLTGCWLFFDSFSKIEVTAMADTIENTIIPYVESESWPDAQSALKKLNEEWHSYRRIAHLFLDAENINEIDSQLARTIEYTQAADVSNTSGELNSIADQLRLLHSREKITLGNIF